MVAPAQSKCCLPLSTNVQDITETAFPGAPASRERWYILVMISKKRQTNHMHEFRIWCSHFVHFVFAFCSLFVRIRCLLCADFVLTWCLLCAYYGSHWAAGRPGTTFAGHWISPKDVKQTSKNEWHKYKLHEWKQEAQTLIRPRRRSPNAVCHFPQKRKISLKLLSSGLPLSEWRGTFLQLF